MRPHGRRGGGEEARETPELWFISMADLMSLLFAFFVLLTSASAAPKDCNGLAKYFDEHRAQYKSFELQSSKLQCVIILPSDFLFQSGQDALQPQALVPLRPLFQEILKLPEHQKDLFIVEGHTDNVPISTKRFPSNWELSSSRATNLGDVMRQLGMPEDRLSVRAFAGNRPRVPYTDDYGKALGGQALQEARRLNRRVEIVLENPPTKLEEYTTLFK